jgi:hypothetical protein
MPMRVCKPGDGQVDGFGNKCNWTNCGLDTTANQYFGGCNGNATAGALCCPGTGCANDAIPHDRFGNGMVGCGGSSVWSNASQLCGSGFRLCSAAEWVANNVNGANVAPTADYWTSDTLQFSGQEHSCQVMLSGGVSCMTHGGPMRVCMPGDFATDGFGNSCNWTGCGLNTTTNQYFGGCAGNTTAGALCCPAP